MSGSVRVKICEAKFDKTEAFMETHKRDMARNYVKNLKLSEGVDLAVKEDQVVEDVDNQLTQGKEILDRIREADKKQELEIGDDAESRDKVFDFAFSTYEGVRDLKLHVKSTYDYDFVLKMRLGGTTPQDPRGLLQQADIAASWLKSPDKQFPEKTRSPMIPPLDKEFIAGYILPLYENLRTAVTEYERDLKDTEAIMLRKNQLIEEFDSFMVVISGLFYYMMKFAGMDEEAERLRPNINRAKPRKADSQPDPDAPTE